MLKNRHVIIQFTYLLFAFLYAEQLLADEIEIYPFKISKEVIDFGKVETGTEKIQEITFLNNQNEPVQLNSLRLEQGIPQVFEIIEPPKLPVKLNSKTSSNEKSVTIRVKFSAKKPDTLESRVFFRYSIKNDVNKEQPQGIQIKAIAEGPILRVEPIEFLSTIVGDTTYDFIVIRNEGNKEAEFKFSDIKFEPENTPFAVKNGILDGIKNKPITIQPQREFRIPIQFTPKERLQYQCTCIVKLVGNIKPGYEVLKDIRIRGIGIRVPELDTMQMPDSLIVGIGETRAITVKVKINIKDVPQYVTLLQLRGKLSFRDGALGLAYYEEVDPKDFGTVINGRRVVNVTVPLQRKNTSTGEFEADLPMKIVGVLSDNDTTELSLDEPELFVRRFKLENQVDKVKTSVYVKGFWQNGEETRVLLSKGKGNVGIVLENPVISKDVLFTFKGLTRNASLKIYDNQGTLVFEKEINSSSLPITVPKGVMDFGTYTAVLQYGYEYSTIRFVVVP